MRLFDNIYRSINGVTEWTAEFFNDIFRSVDDRLHRLEERDVTLDGVVGEIRRDAQQTIQAVLDPGIASIRAMQERGFLLGQSETAVTLLENSEVDFILTEGDNRELFTPSVFTVATRIETPLDYAILRTVSYDRITGRYRAVIVTVTGDEGPWDDWIIGALAGSTVAQIELLAQGVATREAARRYALAPVGEDAVDPGSRSALHYSERARQDRIAVGEVAGQVDQRARTATEAADASGRSAATAARWAEMPEDVPVAEGQFSALHWAMKALAFANAAATFNPLHFLRRDGTEAMEGRLNLRSSTAEGASVRLPHGATPSSPGDGDIWTTTFGILARIAGVTRTIWDSTTMPGATTAEAQAGSGTTVRAWSPVRIAEAVLAKFVSPSFSGTPTAPTAAAGNRTGQLANTEFVGKAADATLAAAIAAAAQVGDFLNTLRHPGEAWLRRDGTTYQRSAYPALAALMPALVFQEVAQSAGSFRDIDYSPAQKRLARVPFSGGTISTSDDDGVTWTNRTTSFASGVTLYFIKWVAAANIWVAGGSGGNLATSPDAITWTLRTSNTSEDLYGCDGDGSNLVVVGNAGVIIRATQTGASWTVRASGVTSNLRDIVKVGSTWLIVGASICLTSTSTTASGWTTRANPGSVGRIAADPNGNVIAVGSSTVRRSTDLGVSWTIITTQGTGTLNDVAFGAGGWVIVGNKRIEASADGLSFVLDKLVFANSNAWQHGVVATETTYVTVAIGAPARAPIPANVNEFTVPSDAPAMGWIKAA